MIIFINLSGADLITRMKDGSDSRSNSRAHQTMIACRIRKIEAILEAKKSLTWLSMIKAIQIICSLRLWIRPNFSNFNRDRISKSSSSRLLGATYNPCSTIALTRMREALSVHSKAPQSRLLKKLRILLCPVSSCKSIREVASEIFCTLSSSLGKPVTKRLVYGSQENKSLPGAS